MRHQITGSKSSRGPAIAVALIALGLAASASLAADESLSTRATLLYDSGDYAGALPLLEELAAIDATGPVLYRLFYCQRQLDLPEARQMMLRALTALEGELAGASGIETPFYLANVYRNSGRLSDAVRVAEEATRKVEAGTLPQPTEGMQCFQLGKLYADQDRSKVAAAWYQKAVDRMKSADGKVTPTLQWAARFVARGAFDAGDYDQAAKYYALATEGDVAVEDLDRWAVASVKRLDYGTAAMAWYRALRLEPATGIRYQYAAQLSTQAKALQPLPDLAPDGRAFSAWGQAELEQIMAEKAVFAAQALSEAAAPEVLEVAQVRKMQIPIDEAHVTFIAAALEYTVRGYPIRETAFQSGYAQLIYSVGRWSIESQRLRPK